MRLLFLCILLFNLGVGIAQNPMATMNHGMFIDSEPLPPFTGWTDGSTYMNGIPSTDLDKTYNRCYEFYFPGYSNTFVSVTMGNKPYIYECDGAIWTRRTWAESGLVAASASTHYFMPFYDDDDLLMVDVSATGGSALVSNGYKWNTTTENWDLYSTAENGLPSYLADSFTQMCEIEGEWYLYYCIDSPNGTIGCYKWNSSTNTWATAPSGAIPTFPTQRYANFFDVFEMAGDWWFVSVPYDGNDYTGFKWNTSTDSWDSSSTPYNNMQNITSSGYKRGSVIKAGNIPTYFMYFGTGVDYGYDSNF